MVALLGPFIWWRRQMETLSALLVLCEGNPSVFSDSSHKGQRRGAFMYSLICAWTNGWANHRDAGDVRRHSAHYDVAVMKRGTGWNSEWCFGFDLWSVDFIWLYTQFQNTVIPKSRINMGCNISFGVQVQVQPIFVIKRFIMIRYYAQQRLK